MRRLLKWILVFFIASLISGCEQVSQAFYCKLGYKSARISSFHTAIQLLNKCLELKSLSIDQKATYLQGRAWAHYSLKSYEIALSDQETSFQLRLPTRRNEFISHASFLRKLNRFEESLQPLLKAKKIDETRGHPSMMTQYNLGWSYYELGRYDEAIAAFTTGIPSQPDYPFVFLRRGFAYDKTKNAAGAESDFSRFVTLFRKGKMGLPESAVIEIRKLSINYEVLKGVL